MTEHERKIIVEELREMTGKDREICKTVTLMSIRDAMVDIRQELKLINTSLIRLQQTVAYDK